MLNFQRRLEQRAPFIEEVAVLASDCGLKPGIAILFRVMWLPVLAYVLSTLHHA
jgi:hypothetical protein